MTRDGAWAARSALGLVAGLGALLLLVAVVLELSDGRAHLELGLAAAAALLLGVVVLAPGQPGPWLAPRLGAVIALVLAAAKGAQVGDGWLALALAVPAAAVSLTVLVSTAEAVRVARSAEEERRRARLEGEERERARWARDLHDDTLQELGALQVQLRSAQRTRDEGLRDAALADATALLAGQLATLRHLVAELRPLALDQLGLEPSLAGLVTRVGAAPAVASTTTPQVTLDVDLAGPDRLPQAVEVAAYRVVQESLRNAVRHAAASSVGVRVREEPGRLVVEVSDDGRGLPTQVPGPAEGHVGLVGMRERVELAGGRLHLDGAAGGGLIVRAELPLPRETRARRARAPLGFACDAQPAATPAPRG